MSPCAHVLLTTRDPEHVREQESAHNRAQFTYLDEQIGIIME